MRIGNGFEDDYNNLYQLTIALEDLFVDHRMEINGEFVYGEGFRCYVPVFSLPPPNENGNADGTQDLKSLQAEKDTWYLGTKFMERYFTVLDNRPSVDRPSTTNYNYVGIAACDDHEAHINIEDDNEGKPASKASVILGLTVVGIIVIGSSYYCYLKKEEDKTFDTDVKS